MRDWEEYLLAGTGRTGQITLRASGELPGLGGGRGVLVALPPSYEQSDQRYPVVYMHDGQNLFDPKTSFAGDWGLVATLNELALEGVETIVVGIPNRGRRRRYEYSPFRDLLHGGGGGDRYLQFIVATLKPLIDTSFRTLPGRDHTVIAGSSLGGLISLYALYRHAGIFGAAGVQSPALWFAWRAIFRFLAEQPQRPVGRIHLDLGSEEGSETLQNVHELRSRLRDAGYVLGKDLSYVEEEGAEHNEAAWGRRFRDALPFLIGER
jgi:predicted alpha/beta superfamily hydrolase